MQTKILTLVLGLMLSTAIKHSIYAQRHRPYYRHSKPHIGVIIAPLPIIIPRPTIYVQCNPQRTWVEGHWRYNCHGRVRWVPAHWKRV